VVYSLEDQVIEEIPLLAGEDVGKATFSHCYQKLLKKIMMS
jgi:hypothetical protein